MSPKVITIFGATGAQGSSVVRSLAANTSNVFSLRGITRNPDGASAKSLSSSIPGNTKEKLEIIKADGWDKDSLTAAFRGSWAVFANTASDDAVFENPYEKRTEFDLGKNIVDAAAEAGVSVFVYSGSASAKDTTGGRMEVAAFDQKHAIGAYAKAVGVFSSVAIVSCGWYFENFLMPDMAPIFGGFPFIPSEDGTLVFRTPLWGGKEDVPFTAVGDDLGDIVHGVLLEPAAQNGKFIQAVSHVSSLPQVTRDFEIATGKRAIFEVIPNWQDLDVYGVRALETVKFMFGFCQLSGGRYYGVETETETAKALKEKGAKARGQYNGRATTLLTLEKFFEREFR